MVLKPLIHFKERSLVRDDMDDEWLTQRWSKWVGTLSRTGASRGREAGRDGVPTYFTWHPSGTARRAGRHH